MDSIKEENDDIIKNENNEKDIEMDSSCDSVWNTLETQLVDGIESNEHLHVEAKEFENHSTIKKTAIKRSKTIPLITPSTPIVPVNCNESIEYNKSLTNQDVTTDGNKQGHTKKPKMCTVCG